MSDVSGRLNWLRLDARMLSLGGRFCVPKHRQECLWYNVWESSARERKVTAKGGS